MRKECIAMVLAGGKGERLGALTNNAAKPAVHFGGKYRIIDFTLSNCTNSGIDVMGILTQYQAAGLHDYIGSGQAWRLGRAGGVYMLPSYKTGGEYRGTANAVYQNRQFIEDFDPEYVLILSGDHIYKMDYSKMLAYHKQTDADGTIAVISVPLEEASKFGIMNTAPSGRITEFAEKPKLPQSNLASMGVYIFKWSRLKEFLLADENDAGSDNDFGKNVIPKMLTAGEKMYAYRFDSYWKDVGTVQSLWESNMDLLGTGSALNLRDKKWEIFTRSQPYQNIYIKNRSEVIKSIVAEDSIIHGRVENSVLFNSVVVGEGAEIIDSIIMPNVFIGRNAKIHRAIIGAEAFVGENTEIGMDEGSNIFYDKRICTKGISLVGPGVSINENIKIRMNSHIDGNIALQGRQKLLISNRVDRVELICS